MNGTMALPKSVVCRASCAATGRVSQATSGWDPPAVAVRSVAWLTGQVLSYLSSGLVPASVKPVVAHFQPPWADGQTAAMLSAAVDVADLR